MVNLSNNTQGNVNITTRNDTDINANTNGNSQRAKSWAVGEGLIDGVDYSAKYYAGKAKESEEIAERSIQSEGNAQIWAEGTDEEVEALGGEHSSKGWVDYVMENAPTAEIEQTETGATITVTDIHGTTTADILNGATGNGVYSVVKESTVGLEDTYRMTFTDGTYFDYVVTNGAKGTGSVADVQVNGVSVLTGNVANITVDQTFGGTSQNAQSGVAIQGELSTNYQSKLVSGTNIKTINNTSLLGSGDISVLKNTATGSSSLTISGTATSGFHATNIGYGSTASGYFPTALGSDAEASGTQTTALGYNATASGKYAIQIGGGTNSTASTLAIGFNGTNWQLLDGTTGLIPDARISSNIARTSAIPDVSNFVTNTSLATTLADYQPLLVSGTNIKTINNTSLLGSGNISLAEDDTTISKNSDDELQTIGVIDDNSKNAYNFTVVGSPTITADGIASGFSASNYITIANPLIGATKYSIKAKFTLPSTISGYGYVFADAMGATGLSIYYDSNNVVVRCASQTTVNSIGSPTANSVWEVEVIYDNGTAIANYTKDGVSGTKTLNTTGYTNFQATNLFIGQRASGMDTAYFKGSIDLKQFSITVDGVEVYKAWQPQAIKYWSGTKAQYDAIATKDANTLYNVEGVGLYKGTTLIAGALPNAANQDLSNLSATGQTVIDAKVNNDDYYYKSGDTVTLGCAVGGLVTTSGTEVSFTITLPKRLVNITSINCTALVTSFRKSNGGYAPSASWNAKANAQSISIYRVSDCQLQFLVKYGSFGFTNNTPVGCQIDSVSLSFT